MSATIFGEQRQAFNQGKNVLLALKPGEVLPCPDPYDRKKWQALASKYRVQLKTVDGGLMCVTGMDVKSGTGKSLNSRRYMNAVIPKGKA